MTIDKIAETQYQKLAKKFSDLGMETKPISYTRISIHLQDDMLKGEWVTLSHSQAGVLVSEIEKARLWSEWA